jgi:hypothetical protein
LLICTMANDLVKLHGQLSYKKQTSEVKMLMKMIEDELNFKLRDNFLVVLEIGSVVGYDKLEAELERAKGLVAKLNKEIANVKSGKK